MLHAMSKSPRAVLPTTASRLVTHDLVATPPLDEGTESWAPVTYRVFEVWPGNVEATAQHLRGNDMLGEGVCPLVLTNFSPSSRQISSLPATVPWLRRMRRGDTQLELLREVLVEPLEWRGLICVDFVDYAAALTFGGEIRLFRAEATDLATAASSVCNQVRRDAGRGHEAAACLVLGLPDDVRWHQVEFALSTVLDEVEAASLHVASVGPRRGSFQTASVSAMTVLTR